MKVASSALPSSAIIFFLIVVADLRGLFTNKCMMYTSITEKKNLVILIWRPTFHIKYLPFNVFPCIVLHVCYTSNGVTAATPAPTDVSEKQHAGPLQRSYIMLQDRFSIRSNWKRVARFTPLLEETLWEQTFEFILIKFKNQFLF